MVLQPLHRYRLKKSDLSWAIAYDMTLTNSNMELPPRVQSADSPKSQGVLTHLFGDRDDRRAVFSLRPLQAHIDAVAQIIGGESVVRIGRERRLNRAFNVVPLLTVLLLTPCRRASHTRADDKRQNNTAYRYASI